MSQEFVARKGLKSLKDSSIEGNLTVTNDISAGTLYSDNLINNRILYTIGNRIVSSSVNVSLLNDLDYGYTDTLVANVSGGLQTQIDSISGDLNTLQLQFTNLDNTYATDTMVASISGDLQTQVNSLSGAGTTLSISSNDTTQKSLEDKLINGSGLIKSVINEGDDEQLQLKLGPHYLSLASSGLYEGALLSVGVSQGTIDISSGNGLYIDSTTDFGDIQVNGVSITTKTNFLF